MRIWRLVFVLLPLTAGCGLWPTGPDGDPDAVGTVISRDVRPIGTPTAGDSIHSIVVEVSTVRSAMRVLKGCGGVAEFFLHASTRIGRASGAAATIRDLEVGRRVSIWVEPGTPVTLSCTPGAAASRVRIE